LYTNSKQKTELYLIYSSPDRSTSSSCIPLSTRMPNVSTI